MNYNTWEKKYLTLQKEKILSLSRELFKTWEITEKQLIDTYYFCFLKKN